MVSFLDCPLLKHRTAIFAIEIAGFITLVLSAICEFDFSPLVTQDNGFLSDSVLSNYDAIVATFHATTFKWELYELVTASTVLPVVRITASTERGLGKREGRRKRRRRRGDGQQNRHCVSPYTNLYLKLWKMLTTLH